MFLWATLSTLTLAVFGYLIGSISWGIIVSNLLFKEDIRNKGSKNAGATNGLRVYGVKSGLLIFVLDVSKTILAGLVAYFLKENVAFWKDALVQVALFATIIGHVFPLYFKFKGGKGAACLLGFFIFFNWLIALIGFVVFFLIVVPTKKVSLGSLITPSVLIVFQVIFALIAPMNSKMFNYFLQEPFWWTNTIFLVLSHLLVIWSHRSNIKRLLKGQENKISLSKK